MLSCNEICKALSSFEGENVYEIKNYNVLFEQSSDFSKKYLQLVEDKIKENGWVDPNLEPTKFKENKKQAQDAEQEQEEEQENSKNANNENTNDNISNSNSNIILNYKEHQTSDLPFKLLNLIDESRRKDLYYYGMKGPDSFLASILLGAEPNYWLQHRKKKREYADQIKTTFSIQKYDILRGLSKESVGSDYLTVIYSNDFPEHIDSDKSKEFQFLIGIHFKINILILELKTMKGYFATDWNDSQNTLIILLDNQTYIPILSNGIAYFNSEEIKKIEKEFNILYPIKTEVSSDSLSNKSKSGKSSKSNGSIITNPSQIDIKTIKVEHLQSISKYQLKDLQDITEILGLSTEYQKSSGDGKLTKTLRKTKQQLYDEIIAKITSLGN
jgi:hypothetical protein